MKRSEAIRHIINVLRLTGNHYCDNGRDKTDANRILERLEIIGMLPPPDKTDVIHGSLVYCYYIDKTYTDCERVVEVEDSYGELDCSRSKLWEPEDD